MVERRVAHVADTEGGWHFFYFSYSGQQKRATGYVFLVNEADDGGELEKVSVEVEHENARYLRFRFGGRYVSSPKVSKIPLFLHSVRNFRPERSFW